MLSLETAKERDLVEHTFHVQSTSQPPHEVPSLTDSLKGALPKELFQVSSRARTRKRKKEGREGDRKGWGREGKGKRKEGKKSLDTPGSVSCYILTFYLSPVQKAAEHHSLGIKHIT